MGGQSAIDRSKLSIFETLFSAFSAASIAELVTLPLDTIKVTLQVHQGKYKGSVDAARGILATEGFGGLMRGWVPGIARQFLYGTTRIGLYDYMSGQLATKKGGESNITFLDRIGLGITSGALAMCLANPTDMVKVRLQTQDKKNPRYTGFGDAFQKIYKQEGLLEFYRSLPVNVVRNSLVNAAELASYDQIKQVMMRNHWMGDGLGLHLFASTWAGFITAVVSSPIDVIKSNVMNGKKLPDGTMVPFKGIGEAAGHVYGKSGFNGFYQGFNSYAPRVIAWNIVMFVMREQFFIFFYNRKTH